MSHDLTSSKKRLFTPKASSYGENSNSKVRDRPADIPNKECKIGAGLNNTGSAQQPSGASAPSKDTELSEFASVMTNLMIGFQGTISMNVTNLQESINGLYNDEYLDYEYDDYYVPSSKRGYTRKVTVKRRFHQLICC